MAYMSPQEYLNSITGGRGGRVTAYQDPREKDPRNILRFTGDWMNRTGAPQGRLDLSGSRAASGTYDPIPIRQTPTASGPSAFQQGLQDVGKTLSDFGQQQPGGVTLPTEQGADSLGPQSMLSKIGGFLTRTPGLGQTLATLGSGIATESDRPGGSAWTGLARGSEAAVLGEQRRKALEEQRKAREEAKRIQDEDRARRIAAEDLATSQDAARREAYGKILPIDPETGERGEFSMEAWDDAWATAIQEGDTDFAIVLTQMRPEDPEEIPLGDWKEANGAREDENGAWRKVWYRTGADGNIETQLSEYTVAPPAGARAGGAGGQFQKEANLGRVSLAAINNLVDTGGWMSLAGWVRDDDAFDRLQGQILLDNPDATATQIMEATRSSWSKAEGYGIRIGDDGELELDDEGSMMVNLVLSDPSGSSEEGDWMPTKFLKAKLKEWAQSNSAGAAYATATAHALQAINPLVRYLSGAQMTNREAMRYYGAVIPSWGDSPQTVNAKMRGLSLLAQAMGGDIEAMERVDMSGFVDDPNLTPQKNIEARGEWAKAQLNRIVMEEESSTSRGANVEAARKRQEEDLAHFNPDGTPKDPVAGRVSYNPLATPAATTAHSMFRPGYTPTREEMVAAGMIPNGAPPASAPVGTPTVRPDTMNVPPRVDFGAILDTLPTPPAMRTVTDPSRAVLAEQTAGLLNQPIERLQPTRSAEPPPEPAATSSSTTLTTSANLRGGVDYTFTDSQTEQNGQLYTVTKTATLPDGTEVTGTGTSSELRIARSIARSNALAQVARAKAGETVTVRNR